MEGWGGVKQSVAMAAAAAKTLQPKQITAVKEDRRKKEGSELSG